MEVYPCAATLQAQQFCNLAAMMSPARLKTFLPRSSRRSRAKIEISTPEKARISSDERPPKITDVTDGHSTKISPIFSDVRDGALWIKMRSRPF